MATSGSWNIQWASSYWDQPSNYKQYHWSGNWNKSGNTIILSNMKLWMTFTYPSGGTGVTDVVTVTGGSQETVTFPNFNNTYTSGVANVSSTSFSVNPNATSAGIQIAIVGENTGSTTIYFDATYQPPTTPTLTVTATSSTSISITYGTTSFGNPSSGNIVLKYGTSGSTINTVLDTQSTTGNHTFTHTGLTPNTTYYYKATATNTQSLSASSATKSITTPKPPMYGSVNKQTKTVVKFYGSVNGLSKNVVKYYGSVNGKTEQIF